LYEQWLERREAMIFHKSTYNDIQKYYQDNIVKFTKETGDRLWLIKNISPSEVRCVDADGFEIYIDLNEEYEVDYPIPGRTVYQYGKHAAMLFRKPAKQYNRGIHHQNTSLSILRDQGSWQNNPINIHILQQFVDKPAYQDVNSFAVSILDGDNYKESIALDRHFAVTSTGFLFCLSKQIGHVQWEHKTVKTSTSLFNSNLNKLFPDWKIV